MKPRISMIAAIGKDRGLGKDNQLLFTIPDDLARFKKLTSGHVVLMGRKTFESIGHPLPNRTNIVISRKAVRSQDHVLFYQSFDDALNRALKIESSRQDGIEPEVFIIGGGQIYDQALPFADRLYLTIVDAIKPADTFFPVYTQEFTKELSREERDDGIYRYTFVTLSH